MWDYGDGWGAGGVFRSPVGDSSGQLWMAGGVGGSGVSSWRGKSGELPI